MDRNEMLQIAMRQVQAYGRQRAAENREAYQAIAAAWNKGYRFHPEHDEGQALEWERRQRYLEWLNSPAIIKASRTEVR